MGTGQDPQPLPLPFTRGLPSTAPLPSSGTGEAGGRCQRTSLQLQQVRPPKDTCPSSGGVGWGWRASQRTRCQADVDHACWPWAALGWATGAGPMGSGRDGPGQKAGPRDPVHRCLAPRVGARAPPQWGEARGAAGAAIPPKGQTEQGQQQKGPSAKRGTPHAEGALHQLGGPVCGVRSCLGDLPC